MLSLHNPEIENILEQHDIGLLALRTDANNLILIIKMSKEILLTMKICNGFKLSFVEYEDNGSRAHALLTLIYDIPDEPLSLTNTFYDVKQSKDLIELLSQEEFQIYGFDEHNREFFGQLAKIEDAEKFQEFKKSLVLRAYQSNSEPNFENIVNACYHTAKDENKQNTFSVEFMSSIYPEFSHFINTTNLICTPSSELQPLSYSLERKEPGAQQEIDIFLLLERIFPDDDIYLNPIRLDNGEEFSDILVVTEEHALIIQAKDSPNIASSLSTSIERKKSKTLSHLDKAVRQLTGAINHAKQNKILKFKLDGEIIEVNLLGRKVVGLAVVKELFDEDRPVYLEKLMKPFSSTGTPCSALSYMDLHHFSCHVDAEVFFDALDKTHSEGIRRGLLLQTKFQNK
ncbi:hypothetical protein LOY47_10685 [Pseudomonas brassicacearum]|uniref:hypothetical protein n=1 Tax=Pseudomonas brassicacearum TaxID=930166 RepID=UPI00215F6FC5|nr:hypothetical protein [Pseudomonas brassicacearum]UVM46704.1 hypothetical protein LOY47_10685 [Pseudomonas brassicacearum]